MIKKHIPAHIIEMRRVRDKRIDRLRKLLRSHGPITTHHVVAELGVSSALANNYLHELARNGEATICGRDIANGPGRKPYIWIPTSSLSISKPWYRRALEWLTGGPDPELVR